MQIPRHLKIQRTFEFLCDKQDVSARVEKHIEHEHALLLQLGYVPIVGNEVVLEGESMFGGPNIALVKVILECLDWPAGTDKIKYITYDGYVEWKNTAPNKSSRF